MQFCIWLKSKLMSGWRFISEYLISKNLGYAKTEYLYSFMMLNKLDMKLHTDYKKKSNFCEYFMQSNVRNLRGRKHCCSPNWFPAVIIVSIRDIQFWVLARNVHIFNLQYPLNDVSFIRFLSVFKLNDIINIFLPFHQTYFIIELSILFVQFQCQPSTLNKHYAHPYSYSQNSASYGGTYFIIIF